MRWNETPGVVYTGSVINSKINTILTSVYKLVPANPVDDKYSRYCCKHIDDDNYHLFA